MLAGVAGTVTALEAQKNDPKRRSVYVDGQFILGLHEESIILARLKVGQQIDGTRLAEALALDQAKRARDDALLLLSISAKSRRDVERKLLPRYGPDVTESVLAALVRGGWLDDAEFARSFIRSHASHGVRRLAADLARRGVGRDVAGAAIAELLGEVDQTEQAREAAAVRLSRMPGVDRDTAQRRLAGYLSRRGFNFETIAGALAPLLTDLPRAPRPVRQSGFSGRSGLSRSSGSGSGLTRKSGLRRPPSSPSLEEDER